MQTRETRRSRSRIGRRRPSMSFLSCAVALLAAFLAARPALAQFTLMPPTSGYFEWQYSFEADVGNQFPADINSGGEFEVLDFDIGVGIGGPISQNFRIWLDTRYGFANYGFDERPGAAGCGCLRGEAWQTIHRFDFSPGASLVLNDAIQIVAIVPMRWHGESGAERNAISAGIIGAVNLRIGKRFAASLGIGVQSELEKATSVYPVVSLDWQISNQWRLTSTGSPYQGGGGKLSWTPAKRYWVSFESGWDLRRFRLDSGGGEDDGVGQYSAVPLLLGVGIGLTEGSSVTLEGGLMVAGRLALEDSSGNELQDEGFDAAGVIRGSIRIEF